jgi:hypothetical protein
LEDDRYEGKVDAEVYQRLIADYETRKQAIKAAKDKALDEKAAMKHKTEALTSWVAIRNKFTARLTAYHDTPIEILEKVLRENPDLLPEGPKDEAAIKRQARIAFEQSKANEPLTHSEWRELFTACDFRWTILDQENRQAVMLKGDKRSRKVLRRSNIYFNLPIASQKAIRDIALHGPAPG